MNEVMLQALAYAKAHKERFESELKEFLKIPSISADPSYKEAVQRAAIFTQTQLKKAGFKQSKLVRTPGHPLVVAEHRCLGARGKVNAAKNVSRSTSAGLPCPTVLVYGHYDVQPVDPLALWKHAPFAPVVRNRRIYARGASDDKGQLTILLKALEAIYQTQRTLPININVLIEGEEEVGSPSFAPYLKKARQRLMSDAVLICDTEMAGAGQPALTTSLRGLVYVEVELKTASRDVHSGLYGGAVLNAGEILMRTLTLLKEPYTHKLNIKGLYRDVTKLRGAEARDVAKISPADATIKRELGVKSFIYEQYSKSTSQYNFLHQTTAQPSLEISGFSTGYTGVGAKTIIPATARAKVGIRLVSAQDPEHIFQCLQQQLKANIAKVVPKGGSGLSLKVRKLGLGHPVTVSSQSIYVKAAVKALRAVYGRAPVRLRSGGSIPIVADFKHYLNAEPILLGFGLKKDAIHAPNESFSLSDFHKGIATAIRYIYYLAEN